MISVTYCVQLRSYCHLASTLLLTASHVFPSYQNRDDATGEWVHVEIITTFGESMVVRRAYGCFRQSCTTMSWKLKPQCVLRACKVAFEPRSDTMVLIVVSSFILTRRLYTLSTGHWLYFYILGNRQGSLLVAFIGLGFCLHYNRNCSPIAPHLPPFPTGEHFGSGQGTGRLA